MYEGNTRPFVHGAPYLKKRSCRLFDFSSRGHSIDTRTIPVPRPIVLTLSCRSSGPQACVDVVVGGLRLHRVVERGGLGLARDVEDGAVGVVTVSLRSTLMLRNDPF